MQLQYGADNIFCQLPRRYRQCRLFAIYTGKLVASRFGSVNGRPLNFAPESRLPFVQIRSIHGDGREGLKLVSKMAEKKWSTNFRLNNSVRKDSTTFSNAPLLAEIFRWYNPKSRVLFIFQRDFPETFYYGNLLRSRSFCRHMTKQKDRKVAREIPVEVEEFSYVNVSFCRNVFA